jgi:hypothetical protein
MKFGKYKIPPGTLKDVYFWASLFYVIPSIGYVVCHLVEYFDPTSFGGTVSHTVYFVLSILYLIDSVLYYESWRKWRSHKVRKIPRCTRKLLTIGSIGTQRCGVRC